MKSKSEANVAGEAQRIDNEIWQIYSPGDDEICDFGLPHRAIHNLKADIETILLYRPDLEKLIMEKINKSSCYKVLLKLLNIEEIKESVTVRRDWETALRSSETVSSLSSKIGYAFYDRDIKKLAELHKRGKFRKKIERLLENCNFHKECGDLAEGSYNEYL